jgi:Ice-binding-like
MDVHNLLHRVRTLARPGLAAGIVVTLALFSAACSNDSASRINAPPLLSSSSNSLSAAASSAPSLGTASGFAALSGTGVTCTTSTVTGDVGLVGGVFTNTGPCSITGTVHNGDAVAAAAYADFLSAYSSLAAVPCDQTLTGTLAGVTLTPGVYCFGAAATLTGTLTLNGPADGVWIFKIGTGGTGALTGTNFSVVMAGGAAGTLCPNVYWWVAQAATLTTSNFLGTILAGADITVTGGTFIGDALAGGAGSTLVPTGFVTLTNSTIQSCPPAGGIVVHTKNKCNQGVGNGPEGCDPGNSDNHNPSNDELGGKPGNPGRKGGR